MDNTHVAIVTGSCRGIGHAIALKLAQDGHNVVVNYQTSIDKALRVVDEIHATTQLRAVAVQETAPMFFTQQVVPHLCPGSRIIFISTSLTALTTIMSQHFLYFASRSAVEQMVRVLASQDLGRKGITVNSVNPVTHRHRLLPPRQDRGAGQARPLQP
ncbi:Dehydrogenase reductase SDR member 4 [Podila verticillata]|nr:Dehydrogenase reductase SDR member 4 [Podila verticillata]